jgi:hypothetical protein
MQKHGVEDRKVRHVDISQDCYAQACLHCDTSIEVATVVTVTSMDGFGAAMIRPVQLPFFCWEIAEHLTTSTYQHRINKDSHTVI